MEIIDSAFGRLTRTPFGLSSARQDEPSVEPRIGIRIEARLASVDTSGTFLRQAARATSLSLSLARSLPARRVDSAAGGVAGAAGAVAAGAGTDGAGAGGGGGGGGAWVGGRWERIGGV